MKNLYVTTHKLLCITIVSIVYSFAINAQAKLDITNTPDSRVLQVSRKEFIKSDNIEIDINYPKIASNNSAFNQTVSNLVDERLKTFLEYKYKMDDVARKQSATQKWFISVDYDISYIDNDVISVGFSERSYAGGTHPNTNTFSVNFAFGINHELQLNDLFKANSDFVSIISKESINQIKTALGKDADDDWIERGAGPNIKNFSSWTFSKDGLRFVFDNYRVAPYAMGHFESEVPYGEFSSEIRSDKFKFEELGFDNTGNPYFWCRGGHFPGYTENFLSAKAAAARAHFFSDSDFNPYKNNAPMKNFIVKGDEVLIGKTLGNYSCVLFPSSTKRNYTGWVETNELEINRNEKLPASSDWLGKWVYSDKDLNISATGKADKFTVNGNAIWIRSAELGAVNTGLLENEQAVRKGNKLVIETEDDCKIEMFRVGKYLIARDNLNCGGMNVTFTGVYTKK
ncbi:MAG: DUF3298 and DUF4163 domain-containing protein [Pyrinomonadaceae bacterium]